MSEWIQFIIYLVCMIIFKIAKDRQLKKERENGGKLNNEKNV